MGWVMGTAMSFVTSGVISGPMVAGGLLQLVGYWEAWSAPLVVLILDMLARLVMIEPPKTPPTTSSNDSSVISSPPNTVAVPGETTALLSASPNADQSPIADSKEAPRRGFYQIMFRQPRALASMANTVSLSTMFAGFDTCMPLHVRQAFGWGSGPAGMMFLCLQLPPMFLGPLTGWLRDRNGARFPATIGWVLLIPLFLLLGAPGDPRFPWASAENGGKVIYISCLIAIGIALSFVRGSGSLELICKFPFFFFLFFMKTLGNPFYFIFASEWDSDMMGNSSGGQRTSGQGSQYLRVRGNIPRILHSRYSIRRWHDAGTLDLRWSGRSGWILLDELDLG